MTSFTPTKLLSLMLVIVMAFTAVSIVSDSDDTDAATVTVNSWSALQDKVDSASAGDIIVLENDLQADGKDRILVKKTITIDLNGHILDRQRTKSDDDGHVIQVASNAILTINDSVGTGIITGGYAKNGGGINIGDDATCIINGGSIIGNKAKDGGGIFVRGTLQMNGGTISNNAASETGGAIFCDDNCAFSLSNVTISGNTSNNEGGAMRIHMKSDSSITDCIITDNASKKDDGGALSIDAENKTITIADTVISNNASAETGGAIELWEGRLILKGCTISDNYAPGDGGAILNDDCTLVIGRSDKQATVFSGNSTDKSGGAIRIREGTTTVTGAIFEGNTANERGGAIYINNDAKVTIDGGSFSSNMAKQQGGAIFYGDDDNTLTIQGDLVVKGNSAAQGIGIYLEDGKVTCGPLDEKADITINRKEVNTVFTKNYQKSNAGKDPAIFFNGGQGYKVVLDPKTNEVTTTYVANSVTTEGVFIDWRNQINTDLSTINSRNWMSGISGERYIHEINMPGTHDSVMKRVIDDEGYSLFREYSKTQVRYIDDQFEEGARWIDCRLNNLKLDKDDGSNLYLCHGKTLAGTYFGLDHNGNLVSLNTVLGWTKGFLEANPTETIILDMSPETKDDERIAIIYERLDKAIVELSKEINPATGEPFLYTEDGNVNTPLSKVPMLKDVRGKIIIQGKTDKVKCALDFKKLGLTCYSQNGNYKDDADDKIKNVKNFYKDSSRNNLSLLTNAGDHRDFYFQVGLNGTDEPWNTPLEIADEVLDELFTDSELFKRSGIYYGYLKFDAYELEYGCDIWHSNFFDGLEYRTITVKSGLSTDADQVYKLLRGTPISIPGNIYSYSGDFYGWLADGVVYKEGSTLTLENDMVFEAQWDSTEEDIDDKTDGGFWNSGPVWFAAGAIVVLAAVGAAMLIVRSKR